MARLKSEITAFEQKDSESLYEAWERFKGLLRKCPQHGIETWEKARIFFQGMTSSTRTLVNAAAGGSLKTKTPEEALELLESLTSQEFDNAPAPVAPRRSGIMKLEGYDTLLAQNEQMLQMHKKHQEQLDALNKKSNISQEAHATEDCEYIRAAEKPLAEVNGLWYDQKNQNQHPGLSYKSNYQLIPPVPLQQQQQPPQLEWEKVFAQLSKTTSDYIQNSNSFREETRASFRNQEALIRNLETQIGQLSRQFTERTQGVLPSNTIRNNPKKKKKDREASNEEEKEEKAKDTIEVDEINPEKAEKKLFKWERKKALERHKKPLDLSPYARIPYPQRLNKEIQKQQYSKFLDIFRKLRINIPFAEALENMPNYARFMKDLSSRKRKLWECETVNLTEECNAISEKKLPTKVKDPGSFSIPCTIGKMKVDNVLYDLGASINVMPLSMMKKLGITEVKPTKTIVQLADRSSKQAYGIIEDILVKVDKFIVPVDFVILDIEEDATIPMIFGRPFLATSGALIDVLKGELILRVDGEQVTFKFFDKEVPSSADQLEDQVYYIGEKKGEEEHNEESSRESKPKVKMEKPSSEGKHVKVKFKVPETTLPHPYVDEHYGKKQFMNDGPWSSPSLCFEPP
ncbi:uncharacterized protein LOC133296867 [Gastrolobium bilobum]|uniref:uncharacterized protein LOC133296867 n=1 Tax=Gastrolobium bilobum TaxID=150636 RepID=UPI002AB146E2|nr:uncharacterized protein LOC133296867 [Gastrolobium bilobum]